MRTFYIALCLIVGLATVSLGDSVRDRMLARVPQIKALKTAQKVGENMNGYLTAFEEAAATRTVVDAENTDRKAAYGAIAAKSGSTPEVVGRLRAEQLRKLADPGEKIQGTDGAWLVKP